MVTTYILETRRLPLTAADTFVSSRFLLVAPSPSSQFYNDLPFPLFSSLLSPELKTLNLNRSRRIVSCSRSGSRARRGANTGTRRTSGTAAPEPSSIFTVSPLKQFEPVRKRAPSGQVTLGQNQARNGHNQDKNRTQSGHFWTKFCLAPPVPFHKIQNQHDQPSNAQPETKGPPECNSVRAQQAGNEQRNRPGQKQKPTLSKIRAARLTTLPAAQTLTGIIFLRCDQPLTDCIQTRHCMKRKRNAVAENR
ncbi:hypothetical protein Enr10x_28680 [Gimesia panareensis]|uniref:Uncharacterized protein n=1 Tax=Gimesia panareensis TaxID=2527978 RepID=A0A517Q7E1_9PLAN|nr:hypothetical protein Enr10x_28680 [Gimesia panareensis]